MGIFPLVRSSPGFWFLHSKSDARWTAGGNDEIWSIGFPPGGCVAKVRSLIRELQVRPPYDLKWGCRKLATYEDYLAGKVEVANFKITSDFFTKEDLAEFKTLPRVHVDVPVP